MNVPFSDFSVFLTMLITTTLTNAVITIFIITINTTTITPVMQRTVLLAVVLIVILKFLITTICAKDIGVVTKRSAIFSLAVHQKLISTLT